MKKTTCRLCGSKNLSQAIPLPSLPLVDSYSAAPNNEPLYPCGLDFCEDCYHIQLCEVVDPNLLFRDGYLFRTADYPWLVKHFERYAKSVYDEFQPGSVLEIGSNDGTLLKMFEDRGCKVLGVDPSDVPSNTLKLKEFFTTKTILSWTPDVILANHVFAHVDDLDELTRGVKNALSPNGVFIFEAAYGLDMLDECLFDTIYHEHLDYHTVYPLVGFFAKHGLSFFRVEHNDCKGGSIRGFVRHYEAQDRGLYVARETDIGKRLKVFGDRLEYRRAELYHRLKPRAAITVGYGASAGPIAAMYHLGLQDKISWLVDDSPRRQRLHVPHSNQIVEKPETLYDNHVNQIVILALRYAEEIKARHPGVRFLVP